MSSPASVPAARCPRPVRSVVGLFAVTVVAVLLPVFAPGGAGPALAHTTLLETAPVDGSELTRAPDAVRLEFDEPIQARYSVVVVIGPDGAEWQQGELELNGPQVTQRLRPGGPPGEYEVAWRVASDDGHPVSGTFGFTALAAAATPEPAESAEPAVPDPDGAGSAAGGPSHPGPTWPWPAAAPVVGLLAVVAIRAIMRARGRGRAGAGDVPAP